MQFFPEEPYLFSKSSMVDNAIRRSTGAGGLEGKTSMLFVKSEPEDKMGYLLYFDLVGTERSGTLQFLVGKLLDSISTFEEKENKPYRERTVHLMDEHVTNRNLIFGSKPYIREKLLLQATISTTYLENLYRVVSHHD